jgi:hypothetical protein
MKRLAIAFVALLLGGCAHQVTLTPRTPGAPIGTGSAPASMGDTGTITVNLNGRTYTGRWVYVRGGSVGVANAFGSSGQFATGLGYGLSMSGPGQALLSADDGSRLRCVFTFSEWGDTGFGECVDDAAGETYDLTIG